ncbi:MAG: M16 family metallopeptidase [Clostridium sp.]
MVEYILDNGMKLIYKNASSELTSMSISIDAGASCDGEDLGLAHATEHMVYKGSKKRSENEINKDLSNVFGFQNAMTNYPYVIYYGTLLKEDFKEGIEIFSDIILNPTFKEYGFKEEMDVIVEELKEWDEDVEQYCEDKLFLNSFKDRRIKYPIIGTQESLKAITLEKIKSFHEEYYYPGNMTIAVVSSIEFEKIKTIIEIYFGDNKKKSYKLANKAIYENTSTETYISYKAGINTCKVLMIFSINTLNNYEIKALRIFNEIFGEGVNSILYKSLRTENGFVYDITTKIAYEKHIKLYKIIFSTAEENLNSSLKLVEKCIEELKDIEIFTTKNEIDQAIKSLKLKRLFREEQSIIVAKELSTYSTMFNDYRVYSEEFIELENITTDFIFKNACKVLRRPLIQIVKNK